METFDKAAEVLKAMAHPERLRPLAALRDGDQCVCHLTALLRERQPYVSQQLAYLRVAGLAADDRDGLNVYYHIRAPRVFVLLDMLSAVVGKPETLREVRISARLAASRPCPHCDTKNERRKNELLHL
jgi:DNA-binding transcriptional ArsR family regulator